MFGPSSDFNIQIPNGPMISQTTSTSKNPGASDVSETNWHSSCNRTTPVGQYTGGPPNFIFLRISFGGNFPGNPFGQNDRFKATTSSVNHPDGEKTRSMDRFTWVIFNDPWIQSSVFSRFSGFWDSKEVLI